MKLSDLDYNLPKNLIANSPAFPRDSSRLMLINRISQSISHHHFYDLADLLTSNDVLVFNQTKVFPAKLVGKKSTGGKIELLLTTQIGLNLWKAIYKGKLKNGQIIAFPDAKAKVLEKKDNEVIVEFNLPDFWEWLNIYGQVPLPPYIQTSQREDKLRKQYQTVYAKITGSVAAPTAGLHFTKRLLKKLKDKGVQMEYVTLNVGLGTFLPVKETILSKHKMHSEHFVLDKQTAVSLNLAKKHGKRIIAVGTTTTRVLETLGKLGQLDGGHLSGETNIFIYPPYKFKFIDGLITNFHLPHSTLLALIYAFAGEKLTKKAYQAAIKNKYRFYSFGDASLIV